MTNEQTHAICGFSAGELARLYASGELSPVDVARAALDRARTTQASFNTFTVIDEKGALFAAKDSERRLMAGAPASAIDGVPVTIKDVAACHGLDVRYGSKTTPDISSAPDAPAVERLRKAGAIIIGITTTPEFGWKPFTDNAKDGITRNPWDSSKTPGGSSGGAAVAAATGAGVLHLGSDGGGSIRIPAAFTGVVGHKPTFGRVPVYPASAFGTLAHTGPLTRTVEDAALMLGLMTGRDLRDWAQPPTSFGDIEVKPFDWAGKRVAYWKESFTGSVDGEVLSSVESVVRDLDLAGAIISEIRLPDHDALPELFLRHWHVAAATKLASIDPGDQDLIDPGFVKAAQLGQRYSAVEYMKAEIQRVQFGTKMELLFEDFDYIISPTVAIPPLDIGREVPDCSGMKDWIDWIPFTYPINLSHQPACSVPCGFTAGGLPIGLQIIGPRGADNSVLSAALTIQQMYPEYFIGIGGAWPNKDTGAFRSRLHDEAGNHEGRASYDRALS